MSRQPVNQRRILCVFARYAPVFATFHHAYQFFPGTVAFMPPLGLLTVASHVPEGWEVRFRDENVQEPSDEDYLWADAVLASGMHVQRERLEAIAAEAHRFGKVAVLGGPSVSACPDYYPMYDILHVGELGDATERLFQQLDRTVERPAAQIVYETRERLALDSTRLPAYDLIDLSRYFVLNIQWSSGCPFTCEFCDIPALYGRNPRYKSPARLLAELDALVEKHPLGGVYFVDDNFIGNRRAARELLGHLVEWQRGNGYQLRFATECTLDLAGEPEILALMREACFTDVFFGIESPDEQTLKAIDKPQNVRAPMLDAIRRISTTTESRSTRASSSGWTRTAKHREKGGPLHRGRQHPPRLREHALCPPEDSALGSA